MVPLALRLHFLSAAAMIVLLATPAAAGVCGSCGMLGAAMDCCADDPEAPGTGDTCPGGQLGSSNPLRTAAEVTPPPRLVGQAGGTLGSLTLIPWSDPRRAAGEPNALVPATHLYTLHAAFLI